MLFLQSVEIRLKGFSVLCLKLVKTSTEVADKLTSERCLFGQLARVENEMNDTAMGALNGTSLLPQCLFFFHVCLDLTLLIADTDELVGDLVLDVLSSHLVLHDIIQHVIVQVILVSDLKLVLETAAPKVVLSQMFHRRHETVLQEPF